MLEGRYDLFDNQEIMTDYERIRKCKSVRTALAAEVGPIY
jgi:hypothetical protein